MSTIPTIIIYIAIESNVFPPLRHVYTEGEREQVGVIIFMKSGGDMTYLFQKEQDPVSTYLKYPLQ